MALAGDLEMARILRDSSALDAAMKAMAEKSLERLQARVQKKEYVPAILFARAYVRLGNVDAAREWLERAAEERNVFALTMKRDPLFRGIQD